MRMKREGKKKLIGSKDLEEPKRDINLHPKEKIIPARTREADCNVLSPNQLKTYKLAKKIANTGELSQAMSMIMSFGVKKVDDSVLQLKSKHLPPPPGKDKIPAKNQKPIRKEGIDKTDMETKELEFTGGSNKKEFEAPIRFHT